jgi:hypothetical protein
MVLDSRFLKNSVKRWLKSNPLFILFSIVGGSELIDSAFNDFKIEQYSQQVIIQYSKRFSSYIKSQDDLNNDIIELANSLMDDLGLEYPISLLYPIVEGNKFFKILGLGASYFISLFLTQVNINFILDFCWGCCNAWSLRNYFNLFTIDGKSRRKNI